MGKSLFNKIVRKSLERLDMPDIYTFDFATVQFPKDIEKKVENEYKGIISNLVAQGKTEEEAKQSFPFEPFSPSLAVGNTIENAINSYIREKHWVEARKQVVAPADVRRLSARIAHKISMAEGSLALTSQEMEFLVKVFDSNLPAVNMFVYVGDALALAKAAQDSKTNEEKATA